MVRLQVHLVAFAQDVQNCVHDPFPMLLAFYMPLCGWTQIQWLNIVVDHD